MQHLLWTHRGRRHERRELSPWAPDFRAVHGRQSATCGGAGRCLHTGQPTDMHKISNAALRSLNGLRLTLPSAIRCLGRVPRALARGKPCSPTGPYGKRRP